MLTKAQQAVLKLLVVLLVVGLIFVGWRDCNPARARYSSRNPRDTGFSERDENVIVWDVPELLVDGIDIRGPLGLVYPPLFHTRLAENNLVALHEPGLAKAWEVVDGRLLIEIDSSVRFQDGSSVTASTVVKNLQKHVPKRLLASWVEVDGRVSVTATSGGIKALMRDVSRIPITKNSTSGDGVVGAGSYHIISRTPDVLLEHLQTKRRVRFVSSTSVLAKEAKIGMWEQRPSEVSQPVFYPELSVLLLSCSPPLGNRSFRAALHQVIRKNDKDMPWTAVFWGGPLHGAPYVIRNDKRSASELLVEAGWVDDDGDGIATHPEKETLRVVFSSDGEHAGEVVKKIRGLGLRVRLEQVKAEAIASTLSSGKADAALAVLHTTPDGGLQGLGAACIRSPLKDWLASYQLAQGPNAIRIAVDRLKYEFQREKPFLVYDVRRFFRTGDFSLDDVPGAPAALDLARAVEP